MAAQEIGRGQRAAIIKEIILENFMSYEYARIPLSSGLNVICGPNGSGKSSILLAASLALGQSYTERSRKLSDLIRWGKDLARVSVVFDNSRINGSRPIPHIDSDRVIISRYMKNDGTYWFEVNYRTRQKVEVEMLLSKLGINPDNMLIIMHQNVIEQFSIVSPQEKLRMVEDAVGLLPMREKILEAKEKLAGIVSEEESISQLLEKAGLTLDYWRGEYQKFMRRKELLERRDLLQREHAWANVAKQERLIQDIKLRIEQKKEELTRVMERVEKARLEVEQLRQKFDELQVEQKRIFFGLLEAEKEKAGIEAASSILEKISAELKNPDLASFKLEGMIFAGVERDRELLGKLEAKISEAQAKLGRAEERIRKAVYGLAEEEARRAVLEFKKELIEDEIGRLERRAKEEEEELLKIMAGAQAVGPRVDTQRNPEEILEEIKVTNALLASLGEVSEEAEKMYDLLQGQLEELKRRASIVAENRKKALEEIKLREDLWRRKLEEIVEEINKTYSEILSLADANGRVRLINMEDIEEAGLELLVGFRGATPSVLDALTQSGGERSVCTMAFLLALQRHIKSPFRAVDEFDVHMDPRNRELITRMLVSISQQDSSNQYIVITPSQLTELSERAHVILVQNVRGKSIAKVTEIGAEQ
jgi:chromosome segregation protein